MVLHLNKLKSPSPKYALYKIRLQLAQWFWRRRLLIFVNVNSLFRTHLPLEKCGPFIWTNLNSFLPRMLCAKFGWNWNSVSEEDLSISLFRNYITLEKGGVLHLNKRESPLPKEAFYQMWLKLVQWSWRIFLNFLNVFSLFCNYLPL